MEMLFQTQSCADDMISDCLISATHCSKNKVLRICSVNFTKSVEKCGFGQSY